MASSLAVIPATLGILGECGVERVGVAQELGGAGSQRGNLCAVALQVCAKASQRVVRACSEPVPRLEDGSARDLPRRQPGVKGTGGAVGTWCGEAGHCLSEGLHHCSDGYRERFGDQLLFQQLTQALATLLAASHQSIYQASGQLVSKFIRPAPELLPVHGSHSLRHLGLGLHLEVGPALGQDAQLGIEVVSAAVLGFPDFVISSCLSICAQAVTSLDLVE